ncbi:MAG: type I-E CRISPR-associated protein Cse2/CasB [Nitrospirae bacterium]|nr:type I-E CRISPR-associated protein Cse2/CasB [Nitrospirota bacterium]
MEHQLPDFMLLYNAWRQLSPGQQAELRRVSKPDELLGTPAFYRLFSGAAKEEWGKKALQRLIFCLPCVTHTDKQVSIGAALARYERGVSEKRLFQIIRSEAPNDLIQMRRILKMVEPVINWPMAAKLLWYWNTRSKRDLLEDYFMNQTADKKAS